MANSTSNIAVGTIRIERHFDAPRELVFANWVDPREVEVWFAPDGFSVTRCEMDATPGGKWLVDFRSADGQLHSEYGEFLEVLTPERLVFTLTQESGGTTGPKTTVTVRFTETDSRTRMLFEQSGYFSAAMQAGNAEGWGECFRKLESRLATMSIMDRS